MIGKKVARGVQFSRHCLCKSLVALRMSQISWSVIMSTFMADLNMEHDIYSYVSSQCALEAVDLGKFYTMQINTW